MRSRCGAWAVLLLGLVVAAACLAPTRASGQVVTPGGRASLIPTVTVAELPASPTIGTIRYVTDGDGASDCTVGLGSDKVPCIFNGTTYVAFGSGVAAEVDTLLSVFGRGQVASGTSESNPLEILGTGAQLLYGAHAFQHSDGSFHFDCFVAAGLNKCDYYRQLDVGFGAGYKDNTGTIRFKFDNDTAKITVANIDATVAGVTLTLFDERHFPVGTCQNATASTNFDTPTSNAPAATCDTGTNTQKAYLAFDATTDESFQDSWILPVGYSSVNVHFRWKAAATTGAVGWCAQLVRVPDGATSDPAFPAQAAGNCVSDTAKGTTLQENAASITGVTCTSCVAGDHVYVRISRDANGGAVTDDMTGDALLLMYGRTFVVNH